VPPRSEEPSLGYISLDASLLYDQAVSAGVREASSRAGIELVECDPGWNRDGVLDCATRLAKAGVHGVISFQPFPELAPDICAITGDAPTLGVVFDQGPCQVSQLRIDQTASGRLAGEAVGALASERWACDVNAYISLESSDADQDGRARMQGYRDGYTAHCPMPERVITLDGADRLVTAQTQVADVLAGLKGKPNIVVGLNEEAILGAMAATGAAGRENHFWYSGQLADPSIRQHIACNERYIASVAQSPERFGDALVPTLMAALAGEDVADELVAELELVTSTNVRQLYPDTLACDA
jgi:ABC-type sugar transport system substrate-binding protein